MTAGAEGTEGTGLAAGVLLVASPELLDPNFERTVVLLLDVDEDGALGVVLNRPSAVPVAEILPGWDDLVAAPDVLFRGGPVATDSALAVAQVTESEGEEPVGFRRMFARTGVVDLDAPTEILSDVLRGMRIFAGYAGWAAEQLEAEIEEGSWYVVPTVPGDLLAGEPEVLWTKVLRRQPGELAWVATRPVDPGLN